MPIKTRPLPKPPKPKPADLFKHRLRKFQAWHRVNWDGISLVLPMPHNKANTRTHWRVEAGMKQAYLGCLDSMLAQKLMPRPPKTPPAKVSITATMYLTRRMDTGNAMNRFKYVEDWLVRNGYLTDDREACLEWLTFPKQVTGNPPPRLEITLTETEAAS